MSTVKKRAIDKIVERLNAVSKPGTVPDYSRMTTTTVDPSQLKTNVVHATSPFELDEESRPKGNRDAPTVLRDFIVTVEHRAKGDGVTPLDSLSDDDVTWTTQALEGSAEPGLWLDIEVIGAKIEVATFDYAYVLHQVFLRVKSMSKTADLSNFA